MRRLINYYWENSTDKMIAEFSVINKRGFRMYTKEPGVDFLTLGFSYKDKNNI